MKNKYLENLEKIEFVITCACTGRCKHCFAGEHKSRDVSINSEAATGAVRKICEDYDIKTLLVFGGEPLLYPEVAEAIISVGKELGIPRRQIITNGYFSKDAEEIRKTLLRLYSAGLNDLLLSVDAFHEETIPIEVVYTFAREAKNIGLPIRLQPAWLVSREDNNPYNLKTREIIDRFADLSIPESDGNIVYPEGNAIKYLLEYFVGKIQANPYTEDPCNVKCLSFSPNGDVLGGNIYKNDISEIIKSYTP